MDEFDHLLAAIQNEVAEIEQMVRETDAFIGRYRGADNPHKRPE